MKKVTKACMAVFFVLLSVLPVWAANYYVSSTGSGTACTQANPCSFQQALDNAAASTTVDDTIIVASGTYNITSTLTYSVANGAGALTIQAANPPDRPVLDGGNTTQIMWIDNGNDSAADDITVKGIVFRNSNGNGNRAALDISVEYADILVQDCVFMNNLNGYEGGGVYAYSNETDTITLRNNIFIGNTSTQYGGGAYTEHSIGGDTYLINNIFSGNSSATQEGGGACLWYSSQATVINNTFYNNTASSDDGGGLYVDSGNVNIYNNIFWANSGRNGDDLYSDDTVGNIYNNDFSCSDFTGSGACLYYAGTYNLGNNINSDPLFVNAAAGDLHLTSNSPAIDSGDNAAPSIPTTDFEGDPRVIDGNGDSNAVADMGADEYRPYIPAPTLNTYGIIFLMLLSGLAGLAALRKRGRVTSG